MTASITMEIVVIFVYSDLRELNVNVQMVWSCLLTKRVAYVSAFQFIMKFLVTWYLLHTWKKLVAFWVNYMYIQQRAISLLHQWRSKHTHIKKGFMDFEH